MDNTTLTQIVRQQEKIRELEAAIAEKDREIERLQTNIDVMKRALRWREWKEDGDG